MANVDPVAREACLASLRSQFSGAPGLVLLAQFRRDGSMKWMNAEVDRLDCLFDADDWDVTASGVPVDLYARQHTFRQRWPGKGPTIWGTIDRLWTLGVDIDCHKALPGRSAPDVAEEATRRLSAAGVPDPAFIDFSGGGRRGGFYLRWLICPVDMGALATGQRSRVAADYRATLSGLVSLLAPLGADPRAVDVGRFLRVPGSANSKYLDEMGDDATVCRRPLHDQRIALEQLLSTLPRPEPVTAAAAMSAHRFQTEATPAMGALPARPVPDASRKAIRSVTGGAHSNGRISPAARVAAALERLNRHRQGLREGHRNRGLYLYVVCLRAAGLAEPAIRRKAERLASQFRPRLSEAEQKSSIAGGFRAGLYKIPNRTLIEQLDISLDEQSQLGIHPHPPQHNADGTQNAESREYYRAFRRESTRRGRQAAKRKERDESPDKVAPSTLRRLLVLKATQELSDQGIRPTPGAVAAKTGLSLPTVRKYQAINDNLEPSKKKNGE